jgi:hypothetical protein
MSPKPPKTLEFQGKTQTVSQWAEETGIPYANITGRLKLGWPVDRALTEAVQRGRRREDVDFSLIGKQLGQGLTVKEKIGTSNQYRVENANGSKSWVVPAYRLRKPEAHLRMSAGSPTRERYLVKSPFDDLEVGVTNLATFCEGMDLDFTTMLNVAAGIQKSHKGWKCRTA